MDASRKIVVAIDESEASSIAFRWVLRNLARKSDHIVFLNSAPYVSVEFPNPDIANEYIVPPVSSMESGETAEKTVSEQSKALVNEYMAQCQEAGISCEGELVRGEPGSWIVDEAKRLRADVVAVGSHDSGVLKRAVMGSVSDHVLHNVHCPVVIVRFSEAHYESLLSKSSGEPRKIVVAVDDSKEAAYAFAWSLQNLCTESDKLTIFHVHHPTSPSVTSAGTGAFGMEEVYIPPDTTDEIEVKALTDKEKLVERYMAYASQETKIACEGMVVTGQTEAKISEGLSLLKADAVVVGTHDRGAIARTFLGSLSDYLAHQSPCPLIVVKHNQNGVSKDDQDLHKHLL